MIRINLIISFLLFFNAAFAQSMEDLGFLGAERHVVRPDFGGRFEGMYVLSLVGSESERTGFVVFR